MDTLIKTTDLDTLAPSQGVIVAAAHNGIFGGSYNYNSQDPTSIYRTSKQIISDIDSFGFNMSNSVSLTANANSYGFETKIVNQAYVNADVIPDLNDCEVREYYSDQGIIFTCGVLSTSEGGLTFKWFVLVRGVDVFRQFKESGYKVRLLDRRLSEAEFLEISVLNKGYRFLLIQ